MSTILEVREGQQNRETSGPKCNRCAYDVDWNPQQAQKDFGKNRPYESGLKDAHECPKDYDSGNTIVRQGYQIIQTPDGKSKAICLIAKAQQTTFSPYSPSNEIKKEIEDLKNAIESMTMETNKLIIKQNQDITELKSIVQNYTQYNPMAPMFNNLMDKLMSYLPEHELKPKTTTTATTTTDE